MKYFKNTELAKLYNISEKSVRNWIQAAQTGKLDLQLYEVNGRPHIANTPRNALALEDLALAGKKYKNKRAFKTVEPSPYLYKLCDDKQIFNLISNIDIHREIPHQYSYLNGGAKHWDQYAHKLLNEKTPNSVTNTIQLVDLSEDYISMLAANYSGVNVVDVGVGNCLPVRQMLEHIKNSNMLRRYIGLDVSEDMLKIANRNIQKWFNEELNFEGYIRDVNFDHFEDLLIDDSFSKDTEAVLNLILFFGGTISNLREPDQALKTIRNSMGKRDIFMMSRKLDTEATRRYFDFTVETPKQGTLNMKEKYMLDLLGIQEDFYGVEQFFDPDKMARIMQVRLKFDVLIKFTFRGRERSIELRKGEAILLWRSNHQTLNETIEQLDRNGFEVLQATKSKDQQYSLFISKLKAIG